MGSAIVRKAWQGKWALVTGASAGIGAAIAVELAAAGVNLVLTARRRERLDELAARLNAGNSVQTRVITADLREREAPQRIFDASEGTSLLIDLLVNNAGFGGYGEFFRSGCERDAEMVQVNCAAVAQLARLFLPRMVERRRGAMMIVSSLAAYQPVPYMATYAATKAFDLLLAEALDEEVRRYGVRVSALCPGPTQSEFGEIAGGPQGRNVKYQSAQQVAQRGLEGLAQGKAWVIPNFAGQMQVFAQRFLPRRMVSSAVERIFRPGSLQ